MLTAILVVIGGLWVCSWLLPLLVAGAIVHEVVPMACDLKPRKEPIKYKILNKTAQAKDFYSLWKEEVNYATGKRKTPVPDQEYVDYWNRYYKHEE